MRRASEEDTIVAISTPPGEGGIGIVRLSGKKALAIADRIFFSGSGRRPSEFPTYTTHYGKIVKQLPAPAEKPAPEDILDEVILTVMRAPRSYTREDVVEINCHGGIVALRAVLELVLKEGIRLSEPGEFTQRAFLNGRIDLAQAEAVLDIIRAKTDASLRVALRQLEGSLSRKIGEFREEIINILASLEASIDFPEEDIEIIKNEGVLAKGRKIHNGLGELLASSRKGIVLREGVSTVICGKPNVGKSSLMNALLKVERVIVTPVPGTTRDAIEEIMNIEGIPLRIVDTAGIVETEDLIEKEGVSRSRQYLRAADLVIFVLDGSRPLSEKDLVIMEELKNKEVVVVVNKIDLPQKIGLSRMGEFLKNKEVVRISAVRGEGIEALEKSIVSLIWKGEVFSDSETLLTNIRQEESVRLAQRSVSRALKAVKAGLPPECVAHDFREALDSLGEIVGETSSDDILKRIFEQFCIGK